jgi:hypothetical protein
MPTPPDFTAYTPLTAAQLNQAGLWLVKSQTVPAGGTSFTVTGAFSADYRNYRIVFDNIGGASGNSAFMQINGSTGSTYTTSGRYMSSLGSADATVTDTGFWLGIMGTGYSGTIDIYRPFLAAATTTTSTTTSATYFNVNGGNDTNAVSSTAFTIRLAAGTLTAGTVRVYGYRN